MSVYHGRSLGKLLIEEGVLPKDMPISDVTLNIPVDGAVMLNVNIFVTDEHFAGIQRAIARLMDREESLKP